ncbi:UNVERIFIED_CONTAM: hypothetical protein FKN15_009960 [Acipenser sinensis]
MKHSNQTKAIPDMALTERINESSTVTEVSCHVSGFYPPEVEVRWVSDRQRQLEDSVQSGMLLPNQDGTYQLRKTLMLYPEELRRHNYSCQVEHSSFPNTRTLKWGRKREETGGVFGASALGAALRRFVQRFCASCLVLCTWDSVLDAPRRFDARCTHLDARCVDARCTHLDTRRFDARCTYIDARRLVRRRSVHAPRRFGASTLGARTSTLDASALDAWRIDASTLGARASTLDALTLGARTSTLDASALDASALDASTLGARTSTLGARTSTLRRFDARCTHLDARRFGARRSVHAPPRSVHAPRRFGASTLGARTSTLDASTLGARTSTLDASALRRSVYAPRRFSASTLSARTTMSGFHRCVTCQAKLPASDPHDDCVSCLGPDHAASALADRAYCQLCAGFQTRTLRQRARKAVGGRSPSSGSSHTILAPPSSAFTPPVVAQPPRSPSSQLTAGQRSPARRARERSRSPSSRGARPRRESRSRSRLPRRRRYSRSPRRGRRHQETSGVAELTSKMSQFMEVMMGQQSLLMTLANVVPRAPELPTGPVAGQLVVPPPVPHGQPQEVWDVYAVSRDASDAEPLFDEGTEPEVTSQHSEQDDPEVLDTNDPMWSVVERAARHLGVDWPASEPTRRSLFELPSAHTLQSRILPAFPDFIKEVQSTWGAPASTPATSRKAAAFNMHGASEAGLASFPPVGAAFAALVKAPTLSGLAKDPSCPNRQCRITEAHLKKGYAAATEAVRLSNVASLLTVYQAALLRDLPECPSAALRTELGTVAQLLVKLAQLNARAQGRSIASLVVARRQLWLSQARVQEPDKVPLLDAPISPGHTFGPAVEEMLQRSVKAREASQQLAKMWPSKPFQPRRPQERQWRRAPPQQQAQSRGSMTAPSGVSARGQPAFVRPQRGGWRPRGGGKPRPRGSGQAPQPHFNSDNGGSNVWLIAVVCGLVILLVGLVLGVVWMVRKKKNNRRNSATGRGQQPINIRLSVMAVTRRGLPSDEKKACGSAGIGTAGTEIPERELK